MTPEEAIKLLDDVCSRTNSNREGHVKMQAALDTLREVIRPNPIAPDGQDQWIKDEEDHTGKNIQKKK